MLLRSAVSVLLAAACGAAHAAPWSYQGRLLDQGLPADGSYDLQLTAFTEAAGGEALGEPVVFENVLVTAGAFRVEGEFPAAAGRAEAWIEAAVRDGAGGGPFVKLDARERIALAPAVGACWSTTGDSGTNAALHFLGTTDQQALILRVANQPVARFEPSTWFDAGSPVTANVIQGASTNAVTAGVRGTTISGGGVLAPGADLNFLYANPNRASDSYAVIAGGADNLAGNNSGTIVDAAFTAIGGGTSNTASAIYATVAGGGENVAGGVGSAVGGGELNTASGLDGSVAGGRSNRAQGNYSHVAGGSGNVAGGAWSAIGGGNSNCAGGSYSFAAGRNARVRASNAGNPCGVADSGDADGDEGSFVWADAQPGTFSSLGPNQFLVRADGGVYLNSVLGSSAADLVIGTRQTSGDADSDAFWITRNSKVGSLYLRDADGSWQMTRSDGTGGFFLSFSNGAYLSSGGTFVNASARAMKHQFETIDQARVLDALLTLPVTSWKYRQSEEGPHVGPVAEEFAAAFGFGDGRTIAAVDADGIAFAAIQGLAARLEAENRELRARLDRLEQALLRD